MSDRLGRTLSKMLVVVFMTSFFMNLKAAYGKQIGSDSDSITRENFSKTLLYWQNLGGKTKEPSEHAQNIHKMVRAVSLEEEKVEALLNVYLPEMEGSFTFKKIFFRMLILTKIYELTEQLHAVKEELPSVVFYKLGEFLLKEDYFISDPRNGNVAEKEAIYWALSCFMEALDKGDIRAKEKLEALVGIAKKTWKLMPERNATNQKVAELFFRAQKKNYLQFINLENVFSRLEVKEYWVLSCLHEAMKDPSQEILYHEEAKKILYNCHPQERAEILNKIREEANTNVSAAWFVAMCFSSTDKIKYSIKADKLGHPKAREFLLEMKLMEGYYSQDHYVELLNYFVGEALSKGIQTVDRRVKDQVLILLKKGVIYEEKNDHRKNELIKSLQEEAIARFLKKGKKSSYEFFYLFQWSFKFREVNPHGFEKLYQAAKNSASLMKEVANFYRIKSMENYSLEYLCEALKWYEKAAAKNSNQFAKGYYKIFEKIDKNSSFFTEQKKEFFKVLYENYLTQAENGDARCQYIVALMLENGWGITQNLDLSLEWLEKAANGNNYQAIARMGDVHYHGKGKEKDLRQAFKCYWKAQNYNELHNFWTAQNADWFHNFLHSYSTFTKRNLIKMLRIERISSAEKLVESLRAFRKLKKRKLTLCHENQPSEMKNFSLGKASVLIEEAMASLGKIDDEEFFLSKPTSFLVPDIRVLLEISGYLQSFSLFGDSYVSLGKQNVAMSQQITKAVEFYINNEEEIIKISKLYEESINQLKKLTSCYVSKKCQEYLTYQEALESKFQYLRGYQAVIEELKSYVTEEYKNRIYRFLR